MIGFGDGVERIRGVGGTAHSDILTFGCDPFERGDVTDDG